MRRVRRWPNQLPNPRPALRPSPSDLISGSSRSFPVPPTTASKCLVDPTLSSKRAGQQVVTRMAHCDLMPGGFGGSGAGIDEIGPAPDAS